VNGHDSLLKRLSCTINQLVGLNELSSPAAFSQLSVIIVLLRAPFQHRNIPSPLRVSAQFKTCLFPGRAILGRKLMELMFLVSVEKQMEVIERNSHDRQMITIGTVP
jgi:hypothetical protein